MQTEITTTDRLLDDNGCLHRTGFAKRPLLNYNPENINVFPLKILNHLRLKEWDYYGLTTRNYFFSVTVSNIGYAGLVFVYYIDFSKKTMIDDSIITPFGKGCDLPRTSESGDIRFEHKRARIWFERREESRHIRVDWPDCHDGAGLEVDLAMRQPLDHESIVVATPIGRKHFYYNQKINCMPAEGKISLGEIHHEVTQDSALGTLDWGRGVWEYSSFWNWASASGFLPDGSTIGLNMGMGFGDLSAATENCFFINGKMTKLEWIEFDYDPSDFMKPWKFESSDGKLNLSLQPFFDRVDQTNLMIIKSGVHQLFGTYSGTVVTDDGNEITVRDVIGWAEEHNARW